MQNSEKELKTEFFKRQRRTRTKKIRLYTEDPANFIFSDILFTKDEHDKDNPVKPMPDKEYLRYIIKAVQGPEKCLFIPKSRQIMMTWVMCAYCLWMCMFQQHRLVFLQSKKEEDSANLVFNKQWLTGRMSFIYFNLPDWLKAWNPVTTSFGIMNFSRTNSKAWGVPQGDNIVRSYTASLLFADEAAFQPEFEEAYAAALPMAEKIVAVSTANPGYFAEIVTAK